MLISKKGTIVQILVKLFTTAILPITLRGCNRHFVFPVMYGRIRSIGLFHLVSVHVKSIRTDLRIIMFPVMFLIRLLQAVLNCVSLFVKS